MIQVSSSANKRQQYKQNMILNENVAQEIFPEWIPRQNEVELLTHFSNTITLLSDNIEFENKSFKQNGEFIAPNHDTLAFVFLQGGKGADSKGAWSGAYSVAWTNPVYGWQVDDNVDYKTQYYPRISNDNDLIFQAGANGNPSSFGDKVSVNGGLGAPYTLAVKKKYRQWDIHGKASSWDLGSGRWRYGLNETQTITNVAVSESDTLKGAKGEIALKVLWLKANERVSVNVGSGGIVDISYCVFKSGDKKVSNIPYSKNDITQEIPLQPKVSINANPTSLEMLIDETKQISLSANADDITYDENKNLQIQEVSRNTDKEVLTLTLNITAKKAGITNLRIKAKDKSLLFPIQINQNQTNLIATPTSLNLVINQSDTIKILTNAKDYDYSLDNEIAQIQKDSNTLTIKALNVGSANLLITSQVEFTQAKQISIPIQIKEAINIIPPSQEEEATKLEPLKAYFTKDKYTDQTYNTLYSYDLLLQDLYNKYKNEERGEEVINQAKAKYLNDEFYKTLSNSYDSIKFTPLMYYFIIDDRTLFGKDEVIDTQDYNCSFNYSLIDSKNEVELIAWYDSLVEDILKNFEYFCENYANKLIG